jgi:hypothetical protein
MDSDPYRFYLITRRNYLIKQTQFTRNRSERLAVQATAAIILQSLCMNPGAISFMTRKSILRKEHFQRSRVTFANMDAAAILSDRLSPCDGHCCGRETSFNRTKSTSNDCGAGVSCSSARIIAVCVAFKIPIWSISRLDASSTAQQIDCS